MTISAEMDEAASKLTIAVDGRFDFSAHKEFRQSYDSLSSKPSTYSIDMGQANYIDSSALGMLLLLRDHAGGDQASVEIVNCSSDVKKILTISNFDQLFLIQ
ncbi:MAG: STAS domain-containing protein [Gammaproteobacteria bacterium]|nr:STAS domain-containing protein [Gammaproteobacteria bacterium]